MSDEDMDNLLTLIENRLGNSWSGMVDYLRAQNTVEEIQAKLAVGDVHEAVEELEDAATKFAHDVKSAFIVSGGKAAKDLDKDVPDSLIKFDATNVVAVKQMEQNSLELVRAVTNEQRELIRQVLVDGVQKSRTPIEIARTIHDSIGLTPSQEQHVANYRAQLESGDPAELAASLQRELRDGRYDAAVRRAMKGTDALSADRIDTMVDLYRDGYVRMRAETVARTEGLRAIHQGTQELYRQAIENGDVDADALMRTWHSAHDGRVRASHRAMDGQKRSIGESFESGDGVALEYPGDPSAPPEETVQCRCVVATRFAG